MPNVLVTGANGQVGREFQTLCSEYDDTFYFTDRNSLDITDKRSIEAYIDKNPIDVIINTAAYTAVDKAEKDEKNADKINHIATGYLAEISKENGIKLIHISTDYVFDGKNYRPYVEDDIPNPNGVYGATKLAGEKVMQEINPKNSVIIRTSWVYSSYGSNFVKTMLRLGRERDRLAVISDQVGTPTYAKDLARTILNILPYIANEDVQIYHYSNEGVCSWFDLAKAIFEIEGRDIKIDPILSDAYPTSAKRPHYSVLDTSKIKNNFNLEIPYWKTSLKTCLEKLNNE